MFREQGIITKPAVNKSTMTKKPAKIINSLAIEIAVFCGKYQLYFLDDLEMFELDIEKHFGLFRHNLASYVSRIDSEKYCTYIY